MEMKKSFRALALMLAMGFALLMQVGCAAEDEPAKLSIIGSYSDNFGGSQDITAETWTMAYEGSDPSVFNILSFDNKTQVVIAQNGATNAYNPDLFSRFDWTISESVLYYCQTAYDAASEQAAVDTKAADAANLETGCGGFFWSFLLPK